MSPVRMCYVNQQLMRIIPVLVTQECTRVMLNQDLVRQGLTKANPISCLPSTYGTKRGISLVKTRLICDIAKCNSSQGLRHADHVEFRHMGLFCNHQLQ